MKSSIFTLTIILLLSYTNAFASTICTDRSPASVAKTLGVDLKQRPQRRTDKPNVVIIIVDDMGYGDLGTYGGDDITPNMDNIAAGGVKFTSGYAASSICSPSRAGLMTGKQPNTLGYARNIIGDQYHHTVGLPLSEKTIADYFKKAGYVTGMIGKWHLGGTEGYLPHDRGFDEYLRRLYVPGSTEAYYMKRPFKKSVAHNIDQSLLSHMESCTDDEKYLTDLQSLEATSFILRHKDEPFLLYFSTDAVHVPVQPRKESLMSRLAYYRYPDYARHVFDRKKRQYLRMLMQLDEAVGHVLGTIDSLGLSEDTMIWFFSDNGGSRLHANNGNLRGGKGAFYEGGLRVPFMVRWPGTIPPAIYDWPITMLDVLPTSLAAIGAYPENNSFSLSGRNVLSHIIQKSTPPVHDLYWRVQHKGDHINKDSVAVRRNDWKLIVHSNRSIPWKSELYNLRQDLSEKNNLIEKEPEIFQSLKKKMTAWTATLPEALW